MKTFLELTVEHAKFIALVMLDLSLQHLKFLEVVEEDGHWTITSIKDGRSASLCYDEANPEYPHLILYAPRERGSLVPSRFLAYNALATVDAIRQLGYYKSEYGINTHTKKGGSQ